MESTHYKTASDISCANMVKLAKKQADQNHNIFLNRMISKNCGNGDKDGYFILGEVINPKHCDNKRSKYNFDWWDTKYKQPCVGEEFNINTKNKKISDKNNFNNCNPPDFSQANQVSGYDSSKNSNFKYNTPKVCGMK
tara:strand:+ start:304 stop:717 length:414 start_codon:yes stop_codon:yes gene_type:complete